MELDSKFNLLCRITVCHLRLVGFLPFLCIPPPTLSDCVVIELTEGRVEFGGKFLGTHCTTVW